LLQCMQRSPDLQKIIVMLFPFELHLPLVIERG
jgi:hypothetical protein